MIEDRILNRIDIDRAMAKLPEPDRVMMRLIFRLEIPEDWGKRRWPPKYEDVGDYIGRKFEDGPLSEAAIRYRRDVVLQLWAGKRGQLRRNRKVNDLLSKK